MSAPVVGGIVAAVLILVGIGLLVWLKRRNRSSIADALKSIALEHLTEVLVPDGMGGEIHVEHLLLTSRGIVVVDVKRYVGIVFASDRMDQWTAIEPTGRQTFPNPLSSLYDRVAAVSQLVRGIDVAGFVVFPSQADFSKGRPQDVLLPEDLLARFGRPEADEIGRLGEAYAPQWEKVRLAVQPA